MLAIKNKEQLDNSKIGNGKQILNSAENTSENSNATKTRKFEQNNQYRTTNIHRDAKSVSQNSYYNKK